MQRFEKFVEFFFGREKFRNLETQQTHVSKFIFIILSEEASDGREKMFNLQCCCEVIMRNNKTACYRSRLLSMLTKLNRN